MTCHDKFHKNESPVIEYSSNFNLVSPGRRRRKAYTVWRRAQGMHRWRVFQVTRRSGEPGTKVLSRLLWGFLPMSGVLRSASLVA